MRLLAFLRPQPAPAEQPLAPGAYPWTTFPRGRRPTDAEAAAIRTRFEPVPAPASAPPPRA